MNRECEDPKLLAYVLDELGENEKHEVMQYLSENADAHLKAQELDALVNLLRPALQAESCPPLTADQRRALEAAVVNCERGPVSSCPPDMPAGRRLAKLAAGLGFVGRTLLIPLILAVLISVFVIPKFVGIFRDFDSRPPELVRLVISASEILSRVWPFLLVLLGGAAAFPWLLSRRFQRQRPDSGLPDLIRTRTKGLGMWTVPLTAVFCLLVVGGMVGSMFLPTFKMHELVAFDSGGLRESPNVAASRPNGGQAMLNARHRVDFEDVSAMTIDDRRHWSGFNTEAYDRILENRFRSALENPLSTFSIDVDTAAYANVRRFITNGTLPPKGAVRIEELINYFDYDYPEPSGDAPFSVSLEMAECPWLPAHRLARIGLKARSIDRKHRPVSNLVFLLDVSGSMEDESKLTLLKQGLMSMVRELGENDRVAIVVYAGASGLVLPSTSCAEKERILSALKRLHAGGSTNGGAGIELAYRTAAENFISGGVNRVILATDGDFNVGTSSRDALIRLIEKKARGGVFLSVLGFGRGNYKDATLEQLADKGNGNYAYIDTLSEARKVLIEEMSGTLVTVAKDVKAQVEFNPAMVEAYRLVGYENRLLSKQDFNDDTKDAGDMGAGHTVTVLYEIVPKGVAIGLPAADPLKYMTPAMPRDHGSDEIFTLKLRYKEPDGNQSERLDDIPHKDWGASYRAASPDFRFAMAVAAYGMILGDSEYKGILTFNTVLEIAGGAVGGAGDPYRLEFIDLVEAARRLAIHGDR